MLATALAAATAIAMLETQLLHARTYENAAARAQADAVARAAGHWAAAVLHQDDPAIDHAGEAWARRVPPFFAERGEVAGAMTDEQSRFNLNNLVRDGTASAHDAAILARLLRLAGQPPELVDALVDWIDPDSTPTGAAGAEDAWYLARDPPYRAANRPLTEVGELARVRGFTPQIIAALAPFVCALPVPTRVNLNTAHPLLLRALVPTLDGDEAAALSAARLRQPYGSREDFLRALGTPPAVPVDDDLDVRSRWFSASATVRMERVAVRYRVLLARPADGGFPRVAAVRPEPW